jgi:hypothetical protein
LPSLVDGRRLVYAMRVDGVVKEIYASPENCRLMASDGPLPSDCLTWAVHYVDQVKFDLPWQALPAPPAYPPCAYCGTAIAHELPMSDPEPESESADVCAQCGSEWCAGDQECEG